MAYVPGFSSDVFVSYAHVDNEVAGSAEASQRISGWVDRFVDDLQVALRKRVGRQVRVWIDHQLDPFDHLTPALLEAVTSSALLLVLMSPNYLTSSWCGRERNAFLEIARQRRQAQTVLLVNILPTRLEDMPPEFDDLIGIDFFDRNPLHTLAEVDPKEPAYASKLFALSQLLANKLETLAHAATPASRAATNLDIRPATGQAFVAHATDDLEEREIEVRHYLTQAGVTVPLRRAYRQATRAEFEAAVNAELSGCQVFIQLLSAARGPEVEFDSDRRLPMLLNEVARQSGKPLLVWRDPRLDLATVVNAAHRDLLLSAIACPIEEFKRMCLDRARPQPEPEPARRTAAVAVFLHGDSEDKSLLESVIQLLDSQGIQCFKPPDQAKATPAFIHANIDRNLLDPETDGVLIIYGSAELETVQSLLKHDGKLIKQRQQSKPVLAVLEGPPDKTVHLRDTMPPGLAQVIECNGEPTLQQLQPFIDSLLGAQRKSGGSR